MAPWSRRDLLISALGAAAGLAFPRPGAGVAADTSLRLPAAPAGRLKQSVSRWPFREIPLPELCRAARTLGLVGIDLLHREDWGRVQELGLICSMGYPTSRREFIENGFCDRANHPMLLRELEAALPLAARHGVPNIIAMFGNRRGTRDAEAVESCVAGLTAVAALAEESRVTICLELLNSKVDHADYQGDSTAFGVQVVSEVGSPRVKLLYDIYHMQIMEGDVIRTIRENIAHIAHFHTAGVPGRHERDQTQELNYGAIARAIADTGFGGYLAHEFIPTRNPLTSLREAVAVCRV
ncbi:MAG: hydroxypyruvate isomerase family protein [Actinomycetota bacterium]